MSSRGTGGIECLPLWALSLQTNATYLPAAVISVCYSKHEARTFHVSTKAWAAECVVWRWYVVSGSCNPLIVYLYIVLPCLTSKLYFLASPLVRMHNYCMTNSPNSQLCRHTLHKPESQKWMAQKYFDELRFIFRCLIHRVAPNWDLDWAVCV